jgi:fructose 1,6-bisphosphate aldolase/phosphatase
MSDRPYGAADGGPAIPLSHYHQSKDELEGLPITVAEKIPVTNTPNIFSYRAYVCAKNPARVRRFSKATKADVGGVGGHVVAADEVKSVIAKFVLDNNGYRGEPIFTSLMVTHTGDDCAVTGIMAESVEMAVVDRLMWDALQEGAAKAAELGLYGPGQDLVADAFTGNLRGAGPATVALPFPVRKDNPSQTVLVSFADKTEPMAFNHFATGAYMLPRFNTGLVIASSRMKRGYLFEIVDLDTKAQAVEAGAHPRDQKALDGKMEELAKGLQEKVITLRAPEDLYDIEGLTRSSRFVIARIWSRDERGEKDQLGYVCSAERLHNIKTKKGFTYGGKDDPVLLAFAQGDWPAPGEITSPWATAPMVAGDCRGSHNLHILPMPINSQTSYWSGPILSAITLSCNIHTGRIGAISDQFALGTPWDEVRRTASQLAIQFRHAHGVKQPATLHEDELEYQEGWKERRARLERQFEIKPALTFTNGHGDGHSQGNGHGSGREAAAPAASASTVGQGTGRPDEID